MLKGLLQLTVRQFAADFFEKTHAREKNATILRGLQFEQSLFTNNEKNQRLEVYHVIFPHLKMSKFLSFSNESVPRSGKNKSRKRQITQ